MTDQSAPAEVVRYAYKASLISSAYQFDLGDTGLRWQISGQSGVWPLESIVRVRLTYRPVSMQSRRFRADIYNSRNERVSILSTTWQTVALMETQDQGYRNFIGALHGRLHAIGSKAEFVAGLRPAIYQASVAVLALVLAATAALFARALWAGLWAGALFIAAFAGLFVWQIGGYTRRNRPRTYRADKVPNDLLP